MNVTSNSQALMLADPAVASRGQLHSEAELARRAAHDEGLRKRVTVVAADTKLVWVRADYFSRTDARERAVIADASYSDLGASSRRGGESQSSPAPRPFSARPGLFTYGSNATTLYARVQGTSGEAYKGAYIDVFV